jgi:hypothetical protein
MRGLLYLGIAVGVLAGTVVLAFIKGKRPEIPGTVKLAGVYVMAKKRRICPFITFGGASA